MQITIDTESPRDVQLLQSLVSILSGDAPKAAAPKAAPAPAQMKAQAAPEPTPEAVEEAPEPVDEPSESTHTLEEAVARATHLVSKGKAKEVKAALTEVGARRVSELAAGDIDAFMAAVADLG